VVGGWGGRDRSRAPLDGERASVPPSRSHSWKEVGVIARSELRPAGGNAASGRHLAGQFGGEQSTAFGQGPVEAGVKLVIDQPVQRFEQAAQQQPAAEYQAQRKRTTQRRRMLIRQGNRTRVAS
jgi:hypothetical protein